MNKWTVLSVVVLIGVLGACVWMMSQDNDPLLETESAAEQEIGVEEFESEDSSHMGDAADAETVLEPDMTMDDAGEEEPENTPPGQALDAGDSDAEGDAGEDQKNTHENP